MCQRESASLQTSYTRGTVLAVSAAPRSQTRTRFHQVIVLMAQIIFTNLRHLHKFPYG